MTKKFAVLGFVLLWFILVFGALQASLFDAFVYGSDFRAYYTAGIMMKSGVTGDLYSLEMQSQVQHSFSVFTNDLIYLLPYLNPPFLVPLFSIFSYLSFPIAYFYWIVFIGTLWILLFVYMWFWALHTKDDLSLADFFGFLFFVITFLPILLNLRLGQITVFMAIGLFAGMVLLNNKRDFWAGLLFCMLFIRPYLIVIPLLFLLVTRRWKAVWGVMTGLTALLMISLFVVGFEELVNYPRFLMTVSSWNGIYGMRSYVEPTWLGFIRTNTSLSVVNQWILWGIIAGGACLFFFWKSAGRLTPFYYRWFLVILLTLLASPHSYYHDFALLVPPLFLIVINFSPYQRYWWWFLLTTFPSVILFIVPTGVMVFVLSGILLGALFFMRFRALFFWK